MAAFSLAADSAVDGIECDVHLSADGVPVVIHDETLERTSDGHGPVGKLTLAELRRLDAGGWFGREWLGEMIPTLEELLAWTGSEIRVNIEIKSSGAGLAVLDLLQEWPAARVLVSSFDHRLLAAMRRESPCLPLGFLCESRLWRRSLSRAIDCAAESFHPRVDRLSSAMLRACHAAGMKVYPWTVDRPDTMRRLLRRGVDGWFTNEPATLF